MVPTDSHDAAPPAPAVAAPAPPAAAAAVTGSPMTPRRAAQGFEAIETLVVRK
eukprot:m.23186 g.23186  ORF g.23186 m.23186 type:complete len:53 (-) comp7087_c0_seq1:1949-2107(-)